jgi:hypothetical protein
MGCHPGNVDSPTADVQEKETVIGHYTTPGSHLRGEEVGDHESVHVGANKFCPGGDLFWWVSMTEREGGSKERAEG